MTNYKNYSLKLLECILDCFNGGARNMYYAIYDKKYNLLRIGYSKNIDDVKISDNEVIEYGDFRTMVDSLDYYEEMR